MLSFCWLFSSSSISFPAFLLSRCHLHHVSFSSFILVFCSLTISFLLPFVSPGLQFPSSRLPLTLHSNLHVSPFSLHSHLSLTALHPSLLDPSCSWSQWWLSVLSSQAHLQTLDWCESWEISEGPIGPSCSPGCLRPSGPEQGRPEALCPQGPLFPPLGNPSCPTPNPKTLSLLCVPGC